MSGGRALRRAAIGLVCIVLGVTSAAAAIRYDPRLRFRTLSTARFDIHFHQGEEALAQRLARLVEPAAAEVDQAIGAAVGRVQVVLVDQHDLSNGWATPLPYNTIEISAAAPSAAQSIGNTDDWLRLVFVHEYTHIAHLSRAGGWIGGLRRGFGRLPLLFPNLYQPIWGIEGLATWQESARTGHGRVPAGDFQQLIRRAAATQRLEPLDRAGGGTVDWPAGAIPYVYGGSFHQYLADRYGPSSVRKLTDETGRRLPYLGARAYRSVYGRSLGQLWRDFNETLARDAGVTSAPTVVRLTRHGFWVSGPRHAPDGVIYYSVANPRHFPTLMALAPGGTPRTVAPRYSGEGIGAAGHRLVVDALERVRSVGLQSDLYLIDPATGRSHRLTREARAQDPDVSNDGRIVCTVQMSDRRALATLPLREDAATTAPVMILDEPHTHFAGPAWSPDGRLIAAERRRLGGPAEIVLVDPEQRTARLLASLPGGRSASPTWSSDGARVLFSSAVGAAPFQIYSVAIATGAVSRLEGTGASAESPDVSPDGRTLVFVGYTVDGYDLFSLPLDDARWSPVETPLPDPGGGSVAAPVAAAAPTSRSTAAAAAAARTYTPWRTLVPQFWTPLAESDGGELVVGAATGSVDALGRHAYGVEAGWSARARPDWRVAYAYDRWRPTLFALLADDTDPWQDGEARLREADVGLLFRVSRVRQSSETLAAVHASQEHLDCGTCPAGTIGRARRVALRAGWRLDAARSFGYSISPEEGVRFSTTAEIPHRSLGADGDGVALTADIRGYRRAGPRHSVLALRAAAAGSWGDASVARTFSAAGAGPQPSGFGFGRDAIGLLRGFDDGDVAGRRAIAVNVDYRTPLRRVDRGIGTVPMFLRVVHGTLFVDAGQAWSAPERPAWTDVRWSVGGELSADTVVGFVLPVTITAGTAWRRDGLGRTQGLVAFGRIGRAF